MLKKCLQNIRSFLNYYKTKNYPEIEPITKKQYIKAYKLKNILPTPTVKCYSHEDACFIV